MISRREPEPKRDKLISRARDINEVWLDAARATGGLVAKTGKSPEVHVQHGAWTVILDKYVPWAMQDIKYTRARAYFIAADAFAFRLSERWWTSALGWMLGVDDVAIGNREMDARFVCRTKHATRLRSLVHERGTQELLLALPPLRFEVRGLPWWQRRKRGSRVRVATVRTDGIVRDIDQLVRFIGLIQATLDGLDEIGVATREPVHDGRYNGDLRKTTS